MNELEYCLGCVKLISIYWADHPGQTKQVCVYIIPNLNGNCPCTQCIVKVMCQVRCSSFYDFRWRVLSLKEIKHDY